MIDESETQSIVRQNRITKWKKYVGNHSDRWDIKNQNDDIADKIIFLLLLAYVTLNLNQMLQEESIVQISKDISVKPTTKFQPSTKTLGDHIHKKSMEAFPFP